MATATSPNRATPDGWGRIVEAVTTGRATNPGWLWSRHSQLAATVLRQRARPMPLGVDTRSTRVAALACLMFDAGRGESSRLFCDMNPHRSRQPHVRITAAAWTTTTGTQRRHAASPELQSRLREALTRWIVQRSPPRPTGRPRAHIHL